MMEGVHILPLPSLWLCGKSCAKCLYRSVEFMKRQLISFACRGRRGTRRAQIFDPHKDYSNGSNELFC